MDIKCPGSGESDKNRFENLRHLTRQDEIKFVIADRADYDWAKRILAEHKLPGGVLFSPVWDKLPARELAEWILADRLPVRLQMQWHKHLWGGDARGV
jgi:7-carboxy-7-deazaguanine synthase